MITIVREEKFIGSYKGIATPLVKMFPQCVSTPSIKSFGSIIGYFGTYERIRFRLLQVLHETSTFRFRIWSILGPNSTSRSRKWDRIRVRLHSKYALSFSTSVFKIDKTASTRIITTPTELIKIRQQNLLIPTRATKVAWQIFRETGFTGLFRGFTATSLRDCGYGPYFAAVWLFLLPIQPSR
jgi:hypothetical protein